MSKTHQELKKTLVEHKRLKKVRVHFDEMNEQLKSELQELDMLEKQLKKEQRDVEKLENSSMRSLFRKILGDREKQLEKERQEYLQASLRYNDRQKSVDLLTYELEILQKKLDGEVKLAQRFDMLMKKREKELMTHDPVHGRELRRIHQNIDQLEVVMKDIDEAHAAGDQAMQILQRMLSELGRARNWGTYDMMGDRRSASYVKHRAIDNARRYASQARHSLMRFKQELNDVYQDIQVDVRVDIGEVGKFTDIFFDNLISDWIVQQKINQALKQVTHVANQVKQCLGLLERERPKVIHDIEQLEIKREEVILKSAS